MSVAKKEAEVLKFISAVVNVSIIAIGFIVLLIAVLLCNLQVSFVSLDSTSVAKSRQWIASLAKFGVASVSCLCSQVPPVESFISRIVSWKGRAVVS